MKKLMLAAALTGVLATIAPAHAAPRCTAVATGATSGGCRYTANGPGTYAVATASGFAVTIWRGQQVIGVAQAAGPAVTAGPIPSLPGDIVDIAIKTMIVRDPNNQQVGAIQDGVITANE